MLLLLLIVLILLLAGVGFGTSGHETYGGYSTPSIGLGGLLVIVLVVLLLTGHL